MIWFLFSSSKNWARCKGSSSVSPRSSPNTPSKSMSANLRCVYCGGGSRVPVSQSRVAQLKQGHVRIYQREDQGRPHELTLKESAKYLGSILHVGASNKGGATQSSDSGQYSARQEELRHSSVPLPLQDSPLADTGADEGNSTHWKSESWAVQICCILRDGKSRS